MSLGWPEFFTVELALLAAVTFVAGLVRGFTGFGAGMVMAPPFIVLVGPARAVPILVLLEWVASARLVPGALSTAILRRAVPLAVPACLAVPLGGALLVLLDPDWVRRCISAVVLAFVVVVGTGWRYERQPGTALEAVTGTISGLLTGLGGVGGPPVVLLLLSGPGSAERNRALLIVFFALTQAVATVAFAVAGLIGAGVIGTALLLAPVFFVGTHVGASLFRPRHEAVYRRLSLALLVLAGIVGLL